MIAPTDKLKQLVDIFPSRRLFCERVDIDDAMLTNILHGRRSPSAKVMENVCLFINWPLSQAWRIVDGKDAVSHES